mgnify:CR=1 FL=1
MSATQVRYKYIVSDNNNRGSFGSLTTNEVTMKTFMRWFGYTLIALAIISASGAAGDCDGHCMENANSILAMTIILFGSACGLILGYVCITLGHRPD